MYIKYRFTFTSNWVLKHLTSKIKFNVGHTVQFIFQVKTDIYWVVYVQM